MPSKSKKRKKNKPDTISSSPASSPILEKEVEPPVVTPAKKLKVLQDKTSKITNTNGVKKQEKEEEDKKRPALDFDTIPDDTLIQALEESMAKRKHQNRMINLTQAARKTQRQELRQAFANERRAELKKFCSEYPILACSMYMPRHKPYCVSECRTTLLQTIKCMEETMIAKLAAAGTKHKI